MECSIPAAGYLLHFNFSAWEGIFMKKLSGLLLLSCLFYSGSSVLIAQESANGTTPPPNVLVIQREFVKPGRAGMMHDRSESAFVRAFAAAKSQSHYFGMTSLSGPSRALFFLPYSSFAAWEKDNQALEHNATLSAAIDHAQTADGDLLSAYDSSVWTYSEESSLNAPVHIADMRYMEISAIKTRPGHRQEWSELVKLYKQGYANVSTAHWALFENMYGTDLGDEYLVITPMKSMSEIDQEVTNDKQFRAALGADGLKKLAALSTACIESAQTNLFQFNPKMSYVPESWIKADPDFWKPKMTTAKKQIKPVQ
jgi:hypothetical protein